MFILGSDTEKLRLKSYSATMKGTRSTITIVVETDDHWQLTYALGSLAEVEEQQKQQASAAKRAAAAQKAKPKQQAQTRLALPPPPRALPKPGDAT